MSLAVESRADRARRFDGITTKQLRDAPDGALYLVMGNAQHVRNTARAVGRRDLIVLGVDVLEEAERVLKPMRIQAVVLDHSVDLSALAPEKQGGYQRLLGWIKEAWMA